MPASNAPMRPRSACRFPAAFPTLRANRPIRAHVLAPSKSASPKRAPALESLPPIPQPNPPDFVSAALLKNRRVPAKQAPPLHPLPSAPLTKYRAQFSPASRPTIPSSSPLRRNGRGAHATADSEALILVLQPEPPPRPARDRPALPAYQPLLQIEARARACEFLECVRDAAPPPQASQPPSAPT